MKHRTHYGTYRLTRKITQAIQLEWDMVEQPAPQRRFLNFPFCDLAGGERAMPAASRNHKRRLAA